MMRYLSFAALLLTACGGASTVASGTGHPAPVPAGDRSPPRLVPPVEVPSDGFQVHMHRGGCYGPCPSYDVTISANGRVDYIGHGHVAVQGERHGQADARALTKLREVLSSVHFDALVGRYVRGQPGCGAWATDMPTVRIDVFQDRRWRHVAHDWGCSAAPAALKQLERDIDLAAQSEQWVSGRPLR